ncbi:MAG TPA: biopolymer transporter ExbD [Deltaproteobacteria bacterium]|nr:biopolymer transporter ExbD [Deltaproteobacteria bacterium]
MKNRLSSRKRVCEEIDLDMVPIMNMFLVLIPFLLMSASFFHLRAINTSVPVLAQSTSLQEEKSDIKLTVIVELGDKEIHLSAFSDEVDPSIIEGLDERIAADDPNDYPLNALLTSLKTIKARYPASDTMIIIPEDNVIYDTIIRTMDVARYSDESGLFPNVVLSGKVG